MQKTFTFNYTTVRYLKISIFIILFDKYYNFKFKASTILKKRHKTMKHELKEVCAFVEPQQLHFHKVVKNVRPITHN